MQLPIYQEPVRYPLFERTKNQRISRNSIACGLFFAAFGIIILDRELALIPSGGLSVLLFVAVFLIFLYWSVIGFWSYKHLEGEFNGFIEFRSHSFVIYEEEVTLASITKLNIYLGDYYGKSTRSRAGLEPNRSQGVDNYIEFTDPDVTLNKIYFKLEDEDQWQELSFFIIEAIKLKKISFLRGIELLHITDYDQIQTFKKALNIDTQY